MRCCGLTSIESKTFGQQQQEQVDLHYRKLEMAEMRRCRAESKGLAVLFLSGQKYGRRLPPLTIPKDIFEPLGAWSAFRRSMLETAAAHAESRESMNSDGARTPSFPKASRFGSKLSVLVPAFAAAQCLFGLA